MAQAADTMRRAARLGRAVPWRWVLFWLLLPNAVILAMWPVGGPGMQYQLALFGILALAVSQVPWTWLKRLVRLAMMLATTV